jgi:hypothetical protein
MGKSKFYAVRKGRSIGIFTDWTTCQNSTARYPGAQFKSFPTREEAEAYLWAEAQHSQQPQQQQRAYGAAAGGTVATATTAPGSKFYAIAKGHRTGVFPGTWSDVNIFVEGYVCCWEGFATNRNVLYCWPYHSFCLGVGAGCCACCVTAMCSQVFCSDLLGLHSLVTYVHSQGQSCKLRAHQARDCCLCH